MSVLPLLRAAIGRVIPSHVRYDKSRFVVGDRQPHEAWRESRERLAELEDSLEQNEDDLKLNGGLRDFLAYRSECQDLTQDELIWLAKINLTKSESYTESVLTAQKGESNDYLDGCMVNAKGHCVVANNLLDDVLEKYKLQSNIREFCRTDLERAIERCIRPARELIKRDLEQYISDDPVLLTNEIADFVISLARATDLFADFIDSPLFGQTLKINVQRILKQEGSLVGVSDRKCTEFATIVSTGAYFHFNQAGAVKTFPQKIELLRIAHDETSYAQGLLYSTYVESRQK